MKIFAALALMLLAAPACADVPAQPTSAPAVKVGDWIKSADGKRVGQINRIRDIGGQPVSVIFIFNGHFVTVPVATLSSGKDGLTTSLSRSDIAHL